MRKKLFVFVTVIFVLLCGIPQAQAKHAPKRQKQETKIVKIRGNQAWVNTGLRIYPQDTVKIKASGKVYFNKEGQSGVSPNGWPVSSYSKSWPDNWNYCDDPEPGMNHAALIGNVGHPNFFIGRQHTFSGKNGTLYIGINDCTLNGMYKNSGQFIVTITVTRGAPIHR
ncbi:MAG: hypothetical protein GXO69_06065 [Acidobacteria bacterium]|nr:hypothetical protein [Acidobacteriota bacterium]